MNDLRKPWKKRAPSGNVLNGLHSCYNRKVIEQAATPACCSRQVTSDPAHANAAADYIAKRLDVGRRDRARLSGTDEQQGFVSSARCAA